MKYFRDIITSTLKADLANIKKLLIDGKPVVKSDAAKTAKGDVVIFDDETGISIDTSSVSILDLVRANDKQDPTKKPLKLPDTADFKDWDDDLGIYPVMTANPDSGEFVCKTIEPIEDLDGAIMLDPTDITEGMGAVRIPELLDWTPDSALGFDSVTRLPVMRKIPPTPDMELYVRKNTLDKAHKVEMPSMQDNKGRLIAIDSAGQLTAIERIDAPNEFGLFWRCASRNKAITFAHNDGDFILNPSIQLSYEGVIDDANTPFTALTAFENRAFTNVGSTLACHRTGKGPLPYVESKLHPLVSDSIDGSFHCQFISIPLAGKVYKAPNKVRQEMFVLIDKAVNFEASFGIDWDDKGVGYAYVRANAEIVLGKLPISALHIPEFLDFTWVWDFRLKTFSYYIDGDFIESLVNNNLKDVPVATSTKLFGGQIWTDSTNDSICFAYTKVIFHNYQWPDLYKYAKAKVFTHTIPSQFPIADWQVNLMLTCQDGGSSFLDFGYIENRDYAYGDTGLLNRGWNTKNILTTNPFGFKGFNGSALSNIVDKTKDPYMSIDIDIKNDVRLGSDVFGVWMTSTGFLVPTETCRLYSLQNAKKEVGYIDLVYDSVQKNHKFKAGFLDASTEWKEITFDNIIDTTSLSFYAISIHLAVPSLTFQLFKAGKYDAALTLLDTKIATGVSRLWAIDLITLGEFATSVDKKGEGLCFSNFIFADGSDTNIYRYAYMYEYPKVIPTDGLITLDPADVEHGKDYHIPKLSVLNGKALSYDGVRLSVLNPVRALGNDVITFDALKFKPMPDAIVGKLQEGHHRKYRATTDNILRIISSGPNHAVVGVVDKGFMRTKDENDIFWPDTTGVKNKFLRWTSTDIDFVNGVRASGDEDLVIPIVGETGEVLSIKDKATKTFEWMAVMRNTFTDKGQLIVGTGNKKHTLLSIGNDGETLIIDKTTESGYKFGKAGTGNMVEKGTHDIRQLMVFDTDVAGEHTVAAVPVTIDINGDIIVPSRVTIGTCIYQDNLIRMVDKNGYISVATSENPLDIKRGTLGTDFIDFVNAEAGKVSNALLGLPGGIPTITYKTTSMSKEVSIPIERILNSADALEVTKVPYAATGNSLRTGTKSYTGLVTSYEDKILHSKHLLLGAANMDITESSITFIDDTLILGTSHISLKSEGMETTITNQGFVVSKDVNSTVVTEGQITVAVGNSNTILGNDGVSGFISSIVDNVPYKKEIHKLKEYISASTATNPVWVYCVPFDLKSFDDGSRVRVNWIAVPSKGNWGIRATIPMNQPTGCEPWFVIRDASNNLLAEYRYLGGSVEVDILVPLTVVGPCIVKAYVEIRHPLPGFDNADGFTFAIDALNVCLCSDVSSLDIICHSDWVFYKSK